METETKQIYDNYETAYIVKTAISEVLNSGNCQFSCNIYTEWSFLKNKLIWQVITIVKIQEKE